jgi:hypothetical protein
LVNFFAARGGGGIVCTLFIKLAFILREHRGVMVKRSSAAEACAAPSRHERGIKRPTNTFAAKLAGDDMAGPRRIFRIQETDALRRTPPSEDQDVARRHGEIMHELGALRAGLAVAVPTPRERAARDGPRLQTEQFTRIARELDAVLKDSEQATQQILAAAEDIDQAANNLSAALKGEIEQGLAQDIRDRVIQVFEACNFQDLTSQRVAKVMAALDRTEQEIRRVFAALQEADAAPPVHGPRLDGDRGHVSQGEIDILFS